MVSRDRTISFVWDELCSYMVVSITFLVISSHHLLVSGDVSSGGVPRNGVSGSGLYKCVTGKCVFELYVKYCEPISLDTWLFTLDDERNRENRPPGLRY